MKRERKKQRIQREKNLTTIMSFFLVALLSSQTVFCDNSDSKADNNMTTETTEHKYTNHLINENSPYLLAHAHNPVDWYPWGKEAINLAREQDRPIFLSIGYAACHWCHVMEHESFENEAIAKILNDNYISIKVDREQRPDLDQIYMSFTQALHGSGGWPMSVFLTPDLKPFYAGTYFPPEDNFGRPGFRSLITQIATAYRDKKQDIVKSSQEIFSRLASQLSRVDSPGELDVAMIANGARALMRNFDQTYGGFGQSRKFPHATELSLFMRHYYNSREQNYLDAVNKALMAMYNGGLQDHLGGGFARYSVDREWKIPHFEKMLYDNALLTITYTEAFQLTKREEYLEAVKSTLDFVLNEMTDRTGGFYSALDADSDGEEGKFYVWTKSEIDSLLSYDADLFSQYYSVTARGNFERKNHLQLNASSEKIKREAGKADWDEWLAGCKDKLMDTRSTRVRPLTDDKILTSWNGLALAGFARGYQVTNDRRYLEAAIKNARFVKEELYRNGQLTHSYRNERRSSGQFLEDYAFYTFGLIELFQVDPKNASEWLKFATELAERAVELFMDESGTLYLREEGQKDLIIRPKDEFDGAIPSAGSLLLGSLLKLHRITEKKNLLTAAEKGLASLSTKMKANPSGVASALIALDYYYGEKIELVLVGHGSELDQMLAEISSRYIPNKIIALSPDGSEDLPMFVGRQSKDGELTAYLCRNSACSLPVSRSEQLAGQLDQLN